MKLTPTELTGVWTLDLAPHTDERGFFARAWCQRELAAQGLETDLVQCNISFNAKRGTLRGMHWQAAPHEETKIVRVTRGALYDVVVDVRPDSPTFGRWIGVELSADNRRALYIGTGFAHGFQTLEDDTEIFYQMGESYHAESMRALRWDDPDVGIAWPIAEPILSDRDRRHPCLAELLD